MKLRKKIAIIAASLVIISLITTAGIFISFLIIKIPYNTEEKADISGSIKISRNDRGFPNVEVNSREDLFFALGYIHAKDQLNLMEYQRAIATGAAEKMAEGSSLYLNRLSAIIGFAKKSDSILSDLSSEETALLNEYCRGINFIRQNFTGGEKLLRDWAPGDLLSILLMREWANSYLNNIELMINVNETDKPGIRRKFRNQKYIRYYNSDQDDHLSILRGIKSLIERHIGIFNRGYSVYIDKNLHTDSQESSTLFNYNDSISVYPAWYPVNIKLGERSIFAVTSPGMPFLFSFTSGERAFYHFNINADTQDFFIIETVFRDSKEQYRSSGSIRDFTLLPDPKTENSPASAAETLRITDKGPVLNDIFNIESADRSLVVINSILPGLSYIRFLLSIPFEKSHAVILSDIGKIDAAPKTFLLVSKERRSKSHSGLFTPYSVSSGIFKNGNITTISGGSRLSTTRNLKAIDKTGSDLIQAGELPGQFSAKIMSNDFRIARFNEILLPVRAYNDKQFKKILDDTITITGKKFVPLFLSMLESNILTSAKLTRIYFNDWDFRSDIGDTPPSIFYSLLNSLIQESYIDAFGKDATNNMQHAYLLYNDFFTEFASNNRQFFNFTGKEKIHTRESIFDLAFLNSMRFLNRKMAPRMGEWQWGNLIADHFTVNNPHLSYLSYIFKHEESPISGGPDTISQTFLNDQFRPLDTSSLKGYCNLSNIRFSTNYSYSTNIASEFYYGRAAEINNMDIKKSKADYRTVIRRSEGN